ncbi:hypothetical protein RSSM_01193 [Rhodopirellula sallentina SM41]|uniref:Uncharacterized protein n=1 Tax=Rhodopirellula sallentina SM41 TaxID=1263870 RepID=M5U792_9BACT|nr:hypothetical protein RSSM_01193 [Rhodopirellula sallentina SM41]
MALDQFGFLSRLPRVAADETRLPAGSVQFSDDIEPLVRLLEETERSKVIETFARKIASGTSYREVLAALLLAGVRNVQPRPSVGFKFHAVLVVNSAHLASLAAPESDRWLPIFWALDYFKSSQARDEREGDWTMSAVDESNVPPSHRAEQAFRDAMDHWDGDAADVAVAALCRSIPANRVFDLMAHYGCRDFRSIGHKAIYVANAYRTLQCIGWQYAEPVLRSLAYAILNHNGEPNPSTSNLHADEAWHTTQEESRRLGENWNHGRTDAAATQDLLAVLRESTPADSVRAVAKMLRDGVATQSISDAIFLSASETLGQQPGIVSLHSTTSTNAMQFALRTTYGDQTRKELLLQNAAFLPYFRESMRSRGKVNDRTIEIDAHANTDESNATQAATVDEIFRAVSTDRPSAAADMRTYLATGGEPEALINAARRLVFLKGNDSHDYKFSSAVLEDYYAVSPPFRAAYLANAAYLLPGTLDRDNGLVGRVKAALV